jgi:glycosyltransferase involved in cell wall biosynthesis
VSDRSVSVVVPTRNRERLLSRCIRALQNQRAADLEIVVVDDASSDGTSAMVRALGDDRIRLIRNDQALGVAGARNRGLEAASSPWVAFCDDDDLWSPRKTEQQLCALHSEPDAGWCSVGAAIVDEQLRVRRVGWPPAAADIAARLLAGNVIAGGGSGVMARTDLVRAAGGFDEELSMFADWDLWIRLALESKMVGVAQVLVLSVRHDANMSLDMSRSRDELTRIHEKYAAERVARAIPTDDTRTLLWMAHADARAGHRLRGVRTCLSVAMRRHSVAPVRPAVLAALGPRVFRLREDYRAHRLPDDARREAELLIEEVDAGKRGKAT